MNFKPIKVSFYKSAKWEVIIIVMMVLAEFLKRKVLNKNYLNSNARVEHDKARKLILFVNF